MKRKLEKYIYSKNIDGVHRVLDANGRYLIGHDVEGCLRAVRQPAASSHRPGSTKRKAGNVSTSLPPTMSSFNPNQVVSSLRHPGSKHPFDGGFSRGNNFLISGVSPANNTVLENPFTKKRLIPQQASSSDLADLKAYLLTTMKGGYLKGMYHSALERRRMCESIMSQGNVTPESLNSLNLNEKERYHLPVFFHSWLPFMEPYVDPRIPHHMHYQPSFSQAMSPLSRLVNGNPKASPMCSNQHYFKAPSDTLFYQSLEPSPVAAKTSKDSSSTPGPRFSSPSDLMLKKTPLNLTPLSEMDGASIFSPSTFGFTPARTASSAPKTLDDIMNSCILPTPNKTSTSIRFDLNSELYERHVKTTPDTVEKPEVKDECSDSPGWTMVSYCQLSFHLIFVFCSTS